MKYDDFAPNNHGSCRESAVAQLSTLGIAHTLMKKFATIFFLAVVLSAKHTARAAGSSLEIVLSDDQIMFTSVTNISMDMVYRNVGETNINSYALLSGLSIVIDGKEFKRESISYSGFKYFYPKTAWPVHISLSEFLIPPKTLVTGRHTVALRDAGSESNTQTIFIEPQK